MRANGRNDHRARLTFANRQSVQVAPIHLDDGEIKLARVEALENIDHGMNVAELALAFDLHTGIGAESGAQSGFPGDGVEESSDGAFSACANNIDHRVQSVLHRCKCPLTERT